MSRSEHYKITTIDAFGHFAAVFQSPGNPLPLFDTEEDAADWLDENAIEEKLYVIQPVIRYQKTSEETSSADSQAA